MNNHTKITIAFGDGIGPEIMDATLRVLQEAKARITLETIEIGKSVYERGYSSGIADNAWQTLKDTKILLKAPITTPQGGGYKSLNVTIRKTLGLFANIRPCSSFHPIIKTKHPKMDLVIVRENEEDLYAGIEYRQTDNSYHSIKLITRSGCEKIIRYAFEYAVQNNRKKVTCFTKDNIMKFTDGLFHKVFDEIGKEYPNIEKDHYIIDIGTAKLANRPEIFDVIVTENLYGDIISDVVAEISGSVGLAGSSNIGENFAMFEAIHGSAPDIAGQNIANPTGLLNAAVMMLIHIGQGDVATAIHNAILKTLEDGMHTADIYNEGVSKAKLGTKEFTDEIIKRLGQKPVNFAAVDYSSAKAKKSLGYTTSNIKPETRELVGVDVSIHYMKGNQKELAEKITAITDGNLNLKTLASRGLKLWPIDSDTNLVTSDAWVARFVPKSADKIATHADIVHLLNKLNDAGLEFLKIENLYLYNNERLGFSLSQGE